MGICESEVQLQSVNGSTINGATGSLTPPKNTSICVFGAYLVQNEKIKNTEIPYISVPPQCGSHKLYPVIFSHYMTHPALQQLANPGSLYSTQQSTRATRIAQLLLSLQPFCIFRGPPQMTMKMKCLRKPIQATGV